MHLPHVPLYKHQIESAHNGISSTLFLQCMLSRTACCSCQLALELPPSNSKRLQESHPLFTKRPIVSRCLDHSELSQKRSTYGKFVSTTPRLFYKQPEQPPTLELGVGHLRCSGHSGRHRNLFPGSRHNRGTRPGWNKWFCLVRWITLNM